MYEHLKKYIEEKKIKVKEKVKKTKSFKSLSTKEKDELLEQIARDLGYID